MTFITSIRLIAIVAMVLIVSSPRTIAQSNTGEPEQESGGTPPPPTFSDVRKTLPKIKASEGRIFFFREPYSGGMFTPTVMLNGTPISGMSSGETFFVDRAPGKYEVSVETEVERKASFTLSAGEHKYVKIAPSMGVIVARFVPALMEEKNAIYEMGPLEYVKPNPPE